MKRLFFVAALALLGLAGCADDNGTPRTYDNNDLELAVGNSARMGCSCMFVMEMDEAYCRAWVRASPDVAKVSFDTVNKKVEAAAFVSWAATARYVDEKRGCVIE